MRYHVLPVVLAGVALAQQVAASPIRVVVVTSHQEITSNVRFGRPTANSDIPAIAQIFSHPPPTFVAEGAAGNKKHGCMGRKMREKALELGNTFRKAFGFPEMEIHRHQHLPPTIPPPHAEPIPVDGHIVRPVADDRFNFKSVTPTPAGEDEVDNLTGEVHILPFIGGPVGGLVHPHPSHAPVPDDRMMRGGHGHGHMRQRVCGSFLRRLNFAITALGPWEGRAVAFVLGCGIGVLLRMAWVMGLLLVRSIRGGRGRNEEDEMVYDVVVFDRDAESIILPPPEYTDEKVALAVAEEIKN